jgi:hypothetical protein
MVLNDACHTLASRITFTTMSTYVVCSGRKEETGMTLTAFDACIKTKQRMGSQYKAARLTSIKNIYHTGHNNQKNHRLSITSGKHSPKNSHICMQIAVLNITRINL